jgi:hypothetical protein
MIKLKIHTQLLMKQLKLIDMFKKLCRQQITIKVSFNKIVKDWHTL